VANDDLGKIWKKRFLALLEMSPKFPAGIEEGTKILSGYYGFSPEFETLTSNTITLKRNSLTP
jgi:hypothetical protein